MRCRECEKPYPVGPQNYCEMCFGPLEVVYDYEAMGRKVSRESISSGPLSMWRYRDLLPIDGEPVTGATSGFTPLIRAERLGNELGCSQLYIKDDSANRPSLSYKDRVVSVAISKAVEMGFSTVGCASTGNLANSVAAHAARVGLEAYLMVPHDLEAGKILGSLIYGPNLVRIRGNYDDVNRLCSEIAERYHWAIVNVNIRPFYTEGAKTFGYEVVEQLGWRLPDHIVVPTAGGTILPKVYKGMREFVELGLVEDKPCQVHCAQAAGCDPVVSAIKEGSNHIKPQKPDTLAKSIAIGNPADGFYVYEAVKESGGWGESVTDEEIINGVMLLARTEGIFTEPAGGTTLAVTKKLIEQDRIPRDEVIVVSITGQGLKTQEAVSDRLPEPAAINAKLKEFDEMLQSRTAQSQPVAQI
jgi:threonine synthase